MCTSCKSQRASLPFVHSCALPPSLVVFNKKIHSRRNENTKAVSMDERTLLCVIATEEVTDDIVAKHVTRLTPDTLRDPGHSKKCPMRSTCHSRWWALKAARFPPHALLISRRRATPVLISNKTQMRVATISPVNIIFREWLHP